MNQPLGNGIITLQATMFPESAKQSQTGPEGGDHKAATVRSGLEREVRDMVNAITHRFSRPEGAQHQHREPEEEDDQHGVRIVTLAGSNMGATMRSELLGDKRSLGARRIDDADMEDEDDDDDEDDEEEAGTFVNSNFQAVNNSILMNSSYNTNDPGVHLDISDVFVPPRAHRVHGTDKPGMRKPLWKRKDKAALSTEHLYSDARSD